MKVPVLPTPALVKDNKREDFTGSKSIPWAWQSQNGIIKGYSPYKYTVLITSDNSKTEQDLRKRSLYTPVASNGV